MAVAGLIIAVLAWLNPDPTSQPSGMGERKPYLETVDAMCLETANQIPEFDEADTESVLASMRAMPGLYRSLLQEWAALDPPAPGDVELIRTQLDALESVARAAENAMEAYDLAGPDAVIAEIEKYEGYAEEFRRSSRAYGLEVCPHILGL